ncbi:outer membrane protein transport protein [Ectothiorhodospira haloalkaliphila]|uniref:OmpP1/FadL family transporter n=1 Tax=Ectothiorhodospira haloalkaliphila TaxID=421628 RepID=UPI001EE82376|nr:outer membrane protein transport protein [Ectothiorhodospira haloalkaliphila]MCG5524969.1 outer membrane protein transport protein [Ectothiorhodospira haloalkaliphila]
MSFIQSRNALSCAVAGALALSGATLWHSPVKAAGFYIQEQSVSGLGRAFAGEAAVARDSSTIFFNPAGMVFLPGTEVQAAVHLLVPKASVSDKGSTASSELNPLVYDGVEFMGGSGGNPYDPTPVPNFFISHQHDDRTWFGFGLTAPFGLANHYDDDFFARYDSTETDLKVLNLQPSMAYRLTDRLAIGGGIDIQYADATLKNAIPDPLNPGGPTLETDGEQRLDADSWDYGFNLGLMWQATDTTRVGLHYRQGIKHTLDGKARVRNPQGLVPQIGEGFEEDGSADLHLPDMVALGLRQELNDRWTLMAQYKWFKWSNFDEIRVRFDPDSGLGDNSVEQNYKDSWALSVGAEYQLDDRWTLRGGLQYDRTPTQDGYRTTRTPDGDRTWYSFGASYEQGPNWGFDVAYTYIDISRESLELTRGQDVGAAINLTGTTEGHVHILAAAVRYRF